MLVAATATFLLASVLYFRAKFLYAGILGIVLAVLLGILLFDTFGLVAALLQTVLLLVIPGLLVIVHAVDARRGTFLLPTIYLIAVGFLGAALCLTILAAARLF